MSQACEDRIELGRLLDYFIGELAEPEEQELESHLFRCATCAAEAERLAGLGASIGRLTPPVLSASRFQGLENEGRIETLNVMSPGQTAEVHYPQAGRLLVHRFEGVDLSRARRVDLGLTGTSGDTIGRFENVPFDAERGEIFVACQSHYAELFPRDIVFAVEVEEEEIARFTIHHLPA